jgi:UPF0042 nucleotide-binding protein
LVVVTGLSGAGKSTVVHALEDLGYFCIDNLPPPVLGDTLDALISGGERRVGLCLDIRAGSYLGALGRALDAVETRADLRMSVLYLDSSEELLARRFSATRRPHPLQASAQERIASPVDGVRLERQLLAPLRARADAVIDTSDLTVHDLRREIFRHYGLVRPQEMRIRVLSFGFKYGIPHDADLMFDVRFLPNPYFVPDLRHGSGLDAAVADYVLGQADCQGFLDRVTALLTYCLPLFQREGKSYLTIAVGCTGGRHRSVAIVERLRALLVEDQDLRLGEGVASVHRDIRLAEEGVPSRPSGDHPAKDGALQQPAEPRRAQEKIG